MIYKEYEKNFGQCSMVYRTGQGVVKVSTWHLGHLYVFDGEEPKNGDVVVAFWRGGNHVCRVVENPDKLVRDRLSHHDL